MCLILCSMNFHKWSWKSHLILSHSDGKNLMFCFPDRPAAGATTNNDPFGDVMSTPVCPASTTETQSTTETATTNGKIC